MSNERWKLVDEYLGERLHDKDKILESALANNRKNDLPMIDVSPTQGEFLRLLVTMTGAKRILEIGTLGGYSTICMAKALPEDGRIITLEANSNHAACATENIRNARFEDRISIRVGDALMTLPELEKEQESFDFIFIDADKPNNPHYLEWALKLAQPGATILADNVVRAGEVINDHSIDPRVHGIRTFLDRLGNEERIDSTAIQTVGEKGYDGFVIGVVKR